MQRAGGKQMGIRPQHLPLPKKSKVDLGWLSQLVLLKWHRGRSWETFKEGEGRRYEGAFSCSWALNFYVFNT